MITKQLKGTTFKWEEENRELYIENPLVDNEVKLSRRHMFSLARFIIRIAQKPLKKRGRR